MKKNKFAINLSEYKIFFIASDANIFKLVSIISNIFECFLSYNEFYNVFSDQNNSVFFNQLTIKEKKYKNLNFILAVSNDVFSEEKFLKLKTEKNILFTHKINDAKERKKAEKLIFNTIPTRF